MLHLCGKIQMSIIKPKYYRQKVSCSGELEGSIEIFNIIKGRAIIRKDDRTLGKGFHIPASLKTLTRGLQIKVYGYIWGYVESAPYKDGYDVIDLSDLEVHDDQRQT